VVVTLEEAARKAIKELDLTGAFKADHQRTLGLHVYKHDGFWTIERLRDGELIESYVGVGTVAEALERIGDWMRSV
jgi:alkanesulfonate monooxygenase SsuD/methylene tetrahydromethanopterin reductase-like flavin-dependent oxidoreductase (luciferase family)